ncbi:MAG: hypothetical protein AAF268_01015 [Cyanobacteria bacterium P01_A01_bin.3]
MRIRWMSLVLGLALLSSGFAGTAWGQTTIERSRDIEVETDSSLPEFEGNPVSQEGETEASSELAESDAADEVPSSSTTIEFTPNEAASNTASEPSALVRYNIRKNVCTGNWSMSELNSLFRSVDSAMVRDVCG